MDQLQLFRVPGVINQPLPEEAKHEACELLAELLIAVIEETNKLRPKGENDG
jgi:hypothetical protein